MPLPDALSHLRNDLHIDATLRGHSLHFKTTWGLFSPKSIDEGSRLLLEHMDIGATDNCLDLGCGYGPLGLCMAKQSPSGRTLLLDKDFVAVDYAQQNAALNGIDNVEVLLSNGFSA
ncbi:MAG: methyltransferase, partial [Pseudomonadota bacterium]